MNKWLYFVLLTAVMGTAVYILYCKGLVMSKSIGAVLFVFCPGRDADKVTLDLCTGWVKHVGRFHESRTYKFTFEAQLSQGNAEVILLDRKKQPLMKLNRQSPAGTIELDAKNRYYLRWDFKRAAGRCALHW